MSDEPDLSRYADVLAWIDDLAAHDDDLLACWVGGSAATGGYDDHSDLDVTVLAAPGTFVRVFEDLLISTSVPSCLRGQKPMVALPSTLGRRICREYGVPLLDRWIHHGGTETQRRARPFTPLGPGGKKELDRE